MALGVLETLEERLNALEREMTQVKARLEQAAPDKLQDTEPRWKGIIGVFKDDPLFDEAERLGREWRNAQREDYDKDADTPA